MSIDYNELLADLEVQLAATEQVRAELEAKESALRTTIDGIKQLLSLDSDSNVAEPAKNQISIPRNAYKNLSIVDAAVKYLRLVGKPQKNKDLVDALIAGGFRTKADQPYVTFRSVLRRAMLDKGAFTYDNKEWGLPEWGNSTDNQTTLDSLLPHISEHQQPAVNQERIDNHAN